MEMSKSKSIHKENFLAREDLQNAMNLLIMNRKDYPQQKLLTRPL